MLIIRNCKFVPELTEGTGLLQGDLVFDRGTIQKISSCGAVCEETAQELDAEGMTALPGLIDAHVHLRNTYNLTAEASYAQPCTRSFDCLKYAKYLLDIGITTIRDCGDSADLPTVALQSAIESGLVTGPRVVPCGLTLSPTENAGKLWDFASYIVDGPEEMRKAVRWNIANGAQFIKLYGSGSIMARGSEPGKRILDEEELLAAVKTAALKDRYCAIHCHGEEAIDMAVRCGVSSIEHASFIGEETLRRMDGRRDCGIVPTLAVIYDIMEHTDPDTEYGSFVIGKTRALVDRIKACLQNAICHDILIGWGTDCNLSAYRREPGQEFRIRKKVLEYDNLDLLKQATINSAKIIRLDQEIGSIKEGKCADVILVDGDPVQDISVMYHPPIHVFKSGVQIR